MLKVRIISSCGMLPSSRRCSKMGSTGHEPISTCAVTALGQDARQVLRDAAAGDVRHAGGHPRADELLDHMQIAAVRAKQRCAGLFFNRRHVLRGLVAGHLEQQLARQRVAVGVQACGGQTDEHVAGL